MAVGQRTQRGVVDELILVEWAVGHQRHLLQALQALQALPGQQAPLHTALAEQVVHMGRRAGCTAGHGGQLAQVGDVEVAHAPLADEAAALQLLEAAHGLGQRRGAASVQQVLVDVIELQPAQAALAGGHHIGGHGVLGQHLADDEELVAPKALA